MAVLDKPTRARQRDLVVQHQGPMCHPHGIRGWGNPEHGVVIVGIAPGGNEISETRRPFTGPSGQLLDGLLQFAKWSRDKVYTTNTICWQNNSPSEEERMQCFPRLARELTELKPKLIIAAGVVPFETLTGSKRRPGSRGHVLWHERWQAYILDTHHPSFALQAQSMSACQDIIRDFLKIPLVLDWASSGENARVTYDVVTSLEEAQAALDSLPRDGRPVSLDIETSNSDIEFIDPYNDKLLCLALSYDNDAGQECNIVFPTSILPPCVRDGTHVRGWRATGKCPAQDCRLATVSALDWPGIGSGVRWTFQAGQYDIPGILSYFGVRLPLVDDTMLMSACTDERPGNHGLKLNGREWLGLGWWDDAVNPWKKKGSLDKVKPEVVYAYNATDSAATKRLVPIFMRRMQEDDTTRLYRDLLIPAIDCFVDQQIRGINVDQKKLQALAYDNWFPKFVEMHRDLQLEAHEIGWPTDDLNFNSSPQMQKLFFQILGIEPFKYSKKTGKPSLDKETLDKLDHPFAAKIRAYRTLDTMVEYVLAVYDHLKHDGLLHPSAFVTTTRTGRTSYRNPAMQTLPKDYTVGADYARLREVIVAHNPETHCIGEADYNQIEVWLAWAESKDDNLLAHLMSGDVHSATAEGAFNLKRTDFTKEEWDVYRQNAKKIRFGLQYGEGAEKLSGPRPVGMGCSVAEARKFIQNFWATYPRHYKWMQEIQRQALEVGYLRTPSGRIMRFPLILDHRELRQASNFPIQGNASDYNLKAMLKLTPLLREFSSWIILNIHDCLVFEIDRRYVHEVAALIKRVMEEPQFDGYPSIKVDLKIGDSLGSVKKYAAN